MEDKKRGSKNSDRPKRIGKNRRDNNRFVGDINTERKNNQPYRNENIKSNVRAEGFSGTAREDMIEGRNAVIEALKSDRTIEYIMIAQGDTKGSISVVIALAKEKSVVVKYVDRAKLDGMSETGAHQGVIAIVTPYNYCNISDILNKAEEKGEDPFILVLDEIEDPHNFGSIIRIAEVCGVHGIIIPKRKNVGVTPTVYKTSAGATEYIKIAKVTNINVAIDELKEAGIWIYGADMHGTQYCYDADLKGAVALVIGSEGKGISKLTKSKCDVLVKIPMVGKVNSLNASVACGMISYEILKQRLK
jgi:23S rRNA (guanosine2251-2'-O)-methyltransferase